MSDYRTLVLDQRRGSQPLDASGRPGISPAQERRREAAKRREETAPLRKAIKDAEAKIAKRQNEIAELDRKLADPKLYERPADMAALSKARAEAVRAVAEAEEAWLALSTELEEASAD